MVTLAYLQSTDAWSGGDRRRPGRSAHFERVMTRAVSRFVRSISRFCQRHFLYVLSHPLNLISILCRSRLALSFDFIEDEEAPVDNSLRSATRHWPYVFFWLTEVSTLVRPQSLGICSYGQAQSNARWPSRVRTQDVPPAPAERSSSAIRTVALNTTKVGAALTSPVIYT